MQEFNKITTFSSFIKNLLSSTYLPVIRTVREGDFILQDFIYLYRCNVIKCTQSGFVGSGKYLCKYDIIDEYDFGINNPKISTAYISNREGYDSYTHIRLGNYLRSLRDMYGLNLMPLYNCFSNEVLPHHYIHSNRVAKMTADQHVKLYKIPIRFNQTYTLCIENPGETKISPAFLYFDNLLALNNNKYQNGLDVTDKFISLYNGEHIKKYSNLRFNHPITFRVDNIPTIKTINYTETSSNKPVKINTNLDKWYKPAQYTLPQTDDDLTSRSPSEDHVYEYSDGMYKLTEDTSYLDTKVYFDSIKPVEEGWYEYSREDNPYSETQDQYIKKNKDYYHIIEGLVEETKSYSYRIFEDDCLFYQPYEQYLNILIQVPDTLNSSIVLLEGDYTKTESRKIFDDYEIETFNHDYLDHLFTGRLKLMSANTKKSYPFSSELREYLLWNVVNPLDSINNNLDRLKIAAEDAFDSYISATGNYWTNNFRHLIYEYASNVNHKFMFDNLGYENSKVEEMFHVGSQLTITIQDASEE